MKTLEILIAATDNLSDIDLTEIQDKLSKKDAAAMAILCHCIEAYRNK